jgi:hypothetical protein
MTSAFDPGEPISYPWAGEWLERYVKARTRFEGDAFLALFSEDAEFRPDPFEAPLTGALAIRAYLNRRAEAEDDVDLTVERHWVSGATILAPWHASFMQLPERRLRVRVAGFLTAEIKSERCTRLRVWAVSKPNLQA